MTQEETIEILEHLLKSIKVRGLKKTLSLVYVEGEGAVAGHDNFTRFVLEVVSEVFGITIDELLNSRYIRGDIKYAIGFCVYYLYQEKTLGEISKKIFVNKNKTLLSKYRQMVCDLNAAHTSDAKYIAIMKELDETIEYYKSN
jgi:hypothetical protein